MNRLTTPKITIIIYIIIIALAVMILALNPNIFTVIHAWESESLPVIKHETYPSRALSIFYLLIIMGITNIAIVILKKFDQIKLYYFGLTPIISIILLILLIINPHSIIFDPTGWPPTHLDTLEIGAVFGIILLILLAINSLISLFKEGFMKKYLYFLGILILGFLLGDLIHESGHAFFILISGGSITHFYPFPVLMGGEFNAGYVGYVNVPPNLEPVVLLGGEIFQWLALGIIVSILYLCKPKKSFRFLLIVLLIIAILDFPLYTINNSLGLPHWFLIGSTYGDIMIFSTITGFPLFILIIIALIQLIMGVILLNYLIIKQKNQSVI